MTAQQPKVSIVAAPRVVADDGIDVLALVKGHGILGRRSGAEAQCQSAGHTCAQEISEGHAILPVHDFSWITPHMPQDNQFGPIVPNSVFWGNLSAKIRI